MTDLHTGPDRNVMMEMARLYSTMLLVPGGKRPIMQGWDRGSNLRLETTEVADEANLGIILGEASGISVIDVDQPDVFLPLAARNGFNLDEHFVVSTPSRNGFHIPFKHNPAMCRYFNVAKITKYCDQLGVDMLFEKSYVVAPGSFIKFDKNGKGVFRQYEIIHDGPVLDDPPDWLMLMILELWNQDKKARLKRRDGRTDRAWMTAKWTPEQCWDACSMEQKLVEGNRNGIVFWFAKVLFQHKNDAECAHKVAGWIDECTSNSFSYREAYGTLARRLHQLAKDADKDAEVK